MFDKIDLRQVLILTRYTLTSEWRTASLRVGGKRRKFSRWWVFWSLLSYLIIGALLIRFFVGNLDGEAFVTAASVVVLFVSIVTASNIFLSFGSGFLSPDEAQSVAALPVTSESFFFSRLTVLLCYTTIISTTISIGPAIGLYFFLHSTILTSLALLVATTLASVASAMMVITVYGLVISRFARAKITQFIGYVQFAGSLITTGSLVILPRVERGLDFHPYTLSAHPWYGATPAFWFGSIVGLAHGVTEPLVGTLAIGAIIFLLLLSAASHILLARNYQSDVTDLALSSQLLTSRAKSKREPIIIRLSYRLLGSPEARAVLMLFRAQFRYDPKFRLSLVASLPITLIYFAVAIITGGMRDPFLTGVKEAINAQGFYMVALFMPIILLQSISQSDNFKASWIFYSSPLDRSKLLIAVRNTLFGWVILPYLLILATLFAFYMPPAHALMHVLVLGAMATFIFQINMMFAPKMPFAERRQANRGSVATIAAVTVVGGFAIVLLGLEMHFGYRTPMRYWTSVLLIASCIVGLEFLMRFRIRTKLDAAEYDG